MDKLELNLLSLEENGDAELEETMDGSPAIQTSSLPFEAFSIRNYVAGVRKVAIKKCWPFAPQFLETNLQKGVDNVLPPLEVPTCRYWGCTDCVESAVNDNPDKSNQERIVGMQLDALQFDTPIQNAQNVFTRELEKEEYLFNDMETSAVEVMPEEILKKDEADQKKVASHGSEDIGSEEAPICNERTFHSRDDGSEDTTTVQLGKNAISEEAPIEAPVVCIERTFHSRDDGAEDTTTVKSGENAISEEAPLVCHERIFHSKDDGAEDTTTVLLGENVISEEAPVICNERTFHSRDDGAGDATTAQLGENEILLNLTEDATSVQLGENEILLNLTDDATSVQLGENEILLNLTEDELHELCSESKTDSCKLTSTPIDSEQSVPTCQSVCANSTKQVFDNKVANEMTTEAYMQVSNVAVKAEAFSRASLTTVEKYRTVNRSHHKNEDDIATENERHQIINDNPDNTPLTSTAGHNFDLDECPTQLLSVIGNEEVILKRKKTESKQQKENGKTQKKRFIADLIATAPSKQIKGDDEDQNWTSENTPRKARIGSWKQKSIRSQKGFKDAMHGLKELKGKKKVISEVPCASILTNFVLENSHPESLEMARKRQCLGVEVESSSSKKIKEETRSADEEELVTNPLERLPTDDLARGWMKKKLVQNFVSDEIPKTKTPVESDDDLMDLAGFLAQKQLERISSLPSSYHPKGKRLRRFGKYPTRHKPNNVHRHTTEQLSDQVQLKSNLSYMEGLCTRQDAFRNSPDQVVSKNGHPCLLVEQGHEQRAHLYGSLVPEELDASRQGQKEGISTAKRNGKVSVSKDHSNCVIKACEKKLDHEGKFAAPVMMAERMYKGYSTPRRKKSVTHDLKKSNTSPEHDHGNIPSEVVPEYGYPYLSEESKCQRINQFLDSNMQEKLIMSEQTKGLRTGPDLQKQSDINGERSLGHRSEHTSIFTRKGGNKKRYCASKRLKSATQKPLKKPKLYSKHDLAGEQNTSTYITAEEVPHDGGMHLESGGGCQQRNLVDVSLMSQGLNVSGQATEAMDFSTGNKVFSSSNDYLNNGRATAETSDQRRKTVSFVAMKGTKEKGSSASQCKPIAASKSCSGIASGSEYPSGAIPKIGKENIVLRSELTSSAAIKQGKGSSTSKKKKSGAYKSIDGTNLSPNQDIRSQAALNCNLAGPGSEDSQADPIAGEGQQMNPDEGHFVPENTVMAGGDDGTGTFSEIRDGVILRSSDCSDIPIRMGEKKSGYKRKAGSCVLMRKQKEKGSSRSPRKKSTGHKSVKERKALAKAAGRQMSIIEETNAALNAALSDGNGSKPPFAGAIIRSNGYCPERNLYLKTCKFIPAETVKAVAGKGFTPQQTLIQPTVAHTFKDRELLIINDNSVQLTLNSEGVLADSNKMCFETLESENSNKKDNNCNQRTNGLKSVSPKGVYASVREPEAVPRHPSVDIPTKKAMQSIGRMSSVGNADAKLVVKNQDSLEDGNSLVQRHGNALSNVIEKQSSSNAASLPVKGFQEPEISQQVPKNNSSGFLPHVTLATPAVESAPEFDQCRGSSLPSKCSTVFGHAQGNGVNIPTKSSQESFCHGNYDLNLYIQERIKAHRSNWASGYEGSKGNASATTDIAARKHTEPDKTIAKNMLGSSSQIRTRTVFETLDLDPLKQNLAETMSSHGKAETKQRIERSPYINVHTNARGVPQVNQSVQSAILPLTKNGSLPKIKDSTSKRTLQSECVEREIVVDPKNLTIGLTPNILKHQKVGRKPAIVTRNARDFVETETWEADTSKHRVKSMPDSVREVLTSQSHTSGSLTPTLLKPLKLAPGRKHYLNMPAQKTKQHIPIHSTFPFLQESIGGKYFQDGPIAYTDQYGRLVTTLDKPSQMEERVHCNFSNASESALAISTQENVRTELAKDLYGRAAINCFPRQEIRVDEVSGGASDKEASVLTSLSKDSSLELSLSIQQGSETVKQF